MDSVQTNTTAAIIVAAGRGTRVGGDIAKQWQILAGRRVIDWTLSVFEATDAIDQIVVVLHADDLNRLPPRDNLTIVTGGATRAASVRAGLEALAAKPPQRCLSMMPRGPALPPTSSQKLSRCLTSTKVPPPVLP